MLAVSNSLLFAAYLLLRLVVAGTSTPADSVTSTTSCVRYRKTGFWDIDIDNFPDLAPECGPPLSLHAIRDKSKLPAEICAVVGAYLFFVLALGSLLLTWGRRMRQSALGSNGTLEIEMVSSPSKKFEVSPTSPASTSRSWIKKGVTSLKSFGGAKSAKSSIAGSNPASPGMASINSFDANVLTDDRDRAQKEMERLYAAVMAHDEAKRSQTQVQEAEMPRSPADPKARVRLSVADSRIISPGLPTNASQVSDPTSPRSPVRAIYPPDHSWPQNYPVTPTSPIVARLPLETDLYPASPPPKSPPIMSFPQDQQQPSSPRSLLRRKDRPSSPSAVSVTSSSSKTRKGIRNLRISAPYPQSPNDLDEREPLTPRQYADPGKPPQPPTPGTATQASQNQQNQQQQQQQQQPPTPHTGATVSSVASSDYGYESLDQPAPLPLPQAAPQRLRPTNLKLSVGGNSVGSGSGTDKGGADGDAAKNPSPSAGPGTGPGTGPSSVLPLRAFAASNAASSAGAGGITSPGPTKTTYLERRADARIPRAPMTARTPMTGRTPRTAVPPTPYSAYMPFTPLTPVTPRLVSRRERKERKKVEGKRVIAEEDAVQEADEMWDM